MLDPAKSYDIRTVELAALSGAPLRAACALTHQTKNLYNTGVFLIRQVVSAYDYDPEAKLSRLRADLHSSQTDAIAHFNRSIDAVNAAREANHPAKVAKALAESKKPPVLKLAFRLGTTIESVFASLLDETVLDTALKTRSNEHGVVVYRRLPAAAAQQVMHRVREAFSSYLQASKRFREDPTGMTGRPQMPNYLGKRDRFPIEVPYDLVKCSLPEPKEKNIPEDDFAPEVSFVPPEALRAFYDHDFRAAIAEACGRRKWAEFKPQHLRIVPLHRGVRVEAVVRIPNPYPAGSFLAGLVATHGDALKALKDDKARERWLLAHLGGLGACSLPRIAGIDLGTSNLAAVAYSTGNRAAVHTGGRFTANLEHFTGLIAERVAFLTPGRVRVLQAKKLQLAERGEKLPRSEEIELRTLLKALYADDEYRRLTARQGRWTRDYLHKLSTRIVADCADREIQVIVIGRNIGWKQEVGMGTDQNRVFCKTAHARLIELIRYKAESRGIAVVTAEESYTSKTSFVNNDELETFAEKTPDKADPKPPVARTGTRSSTDRNWFRHKNRHDRWAWVHADVNGAFNIIRKVFHAFAYHSGLTLKFTLFRLRGRAKITTSSENTQPPDSVAIQPNQLERLF